MSIEVGKTYLPGVNIGNGYYFKVYAILGDKVHAINLTSNRKVIYSLNILNRLLDVGQIKPKNSSNLVEKILTDYVRKEAFLMESDDIFKPRRLNREQPEFVYYFVKLHLKTTKIFYLKIPFKLIDFEDEDEDGGEEFESVLKYMSSSGLVTRRQIALGNPYMEEISEEEYLKNKDNSGQTE